MKNRAASYFLWYVCALHATYGVALYLTPALRQGPLIYNISLLSPKVTAGVLIVSALLVLAACLLKIRWLVIPQQALLVGFSVEAVVSIGKQVGSEGFDLLVLKSHVVLIMLFHSLAIRSILRPNDNHSIANGTEADKGTGNLFSHWDSRGGRAGNGNESESDHATPPLE
jgi:hypothetical protein